MQIVDVPPSSQPRSKLPLLVILIGSAVGVCLACFILGILAWRSIANNPTIKGRVEIVEFLSGEQPNLISLIMCLL